MSELPQKRTQELWFYVELGFVDGGGIGKWEETIIARATGAA